MSDELNRKVDALRHRVSGMETAGWNPARWKDGGPELIHEMLATLEELHVAEEEMQRQNEALAVARDAREAERERYQDLFDAAPDGYVVTDGGGLIREINRAAATLLRVRPPHAVGKPITVFFGMTERQEIRSLLLQLDRVDRREDWEVRVQPRSGPPVDAAVTVASVRDRTGAVGLRWIIRDIGARKRMEEQLRQTQKMEVVGRLAGGVAHDFNNLLTVILGQADVLLGDPAVGEAARPSLKSIVNTAERARALTRQLLAFGRKQALRPEVVDLNALLTGMDRVLRPITGNTVELTMHLDPALGSVRGDPTQLQQVVVNLVGNACDAMPGGGRLSIETGNVTVDDEFRRESPEAREGPHVMLAVTDTGAGMAPSVRGHLFEPFFTTKGPDRGTGLGLATAHGIVAQHLGVITVESAPGRGSTFRIYLPQVAERARPPAIAVPATSPVGSETILLVDDEPDVRELVHTMLERLGYRVIDAAHPGEALLIAERDPSPIHLLLTDLVMPQMNGRELAARIATSRKGIAVLLMSGYVDDARQWEDATDRVAFIEKPLRLAALATKVREVLDG